MGRLFPSPHGSPCCPTRLSKMPGCPHENGFYLIATPSPLHACTGPSLPSRSPDQAGGEFCSVSAECNPLGDRGKNRGKEKFLCCTPVPIFIIVATWVPEICLINLLPLASGWLTAIFNKPYHPPVLPFLRLKS